MSLPIILSQLDSTRRYTLLVLDHVPHEMWLAMPPGAPSHVAWQVGHIGWAQVSHAVGTVCGIPVEQVAPAGWRELFGKGTMPAADPSIYPEPAQLLADLARIHQRVLDELSRLDERVLNEPASHQTGLIHNKFDLLMWVARHEMLHTGQIGLLRRLLGMGPYR